MDLRQAKEFAQYMKLSGWLVERAGRSYLYLRKIPLLPPLIMKSQYPDPPLPLAQIERLAQKYKPLQVQIQPLKMESGLRKGGYKLSKGSGHVTKTLQINLNQSEKKILTQMKKDARYEIKKAERRRIKIIKTANLAQFHQDWKRSVGWRKYVPSLKTLQNLKTAFREKAFFLAAMFERKIIAGTVILIADNQAYYYYAFTSKEGRKRAAQYLLVWEAIKLAKKRGCKTFDFEGIYDERFPNKSWKGFSHFKKSFGGKEKKYPGSFVRYQFFPFFSYN